MKKGNLIAFIAGVIVVQIFVLIAKPYAYRKTRTEVTVTDTVVVYRYPECYNVSEWELFRQALIEVESGGNELAEGKKNDRGIFQITPIYVDEVNRILDDEVYTHIDAFSRQKSLEMFEVMQSYHNPNKSLKKALMLHNPNAMNANYTTNYEKAVMMEYYKLKCEIYETYLNK